MRVYAYMLAFTGRDGEPVTLRPIDIPDTVLADHPLDAGPDYRAAVLNGAFQYGQNDFQPRGCPSLSVGDVIEVETEQRFEWWRVACTGFDQLGRRPIMEALTLPADGDSKADALGDRCPTCLSGEPSRPISEGCPECAEALVTMVEEAERAAGWDPNP